jgi:hypothetical protein
MTEEVTVVAVKLITIFPTPKSSMNLTTGTGIKTGVEVEAIHLYLHHSLPSNHQHIPNPVMNVSNNIDKRQCTN